MRRLVGTHQTFPVVLRRWQVYTIGALTLNASTLNGNSSSSGGGGIYNFSTLCLVNSTLSQNHAVRNAIDAGDTVTGCVDQNFVLLATDQRGAERVVGLARDIGAFEFRPPLYLPLVVR